MANPKQERTFIMVKPDGVQRNLIADIMKRFEQKGFKLVGLKMLKVNNNNIEAVLNQLSIISAYRGAVKATLC